MPTKAKGAVTRVLLADDEPLVRSGIAMLLAGESDLEVVGEVADGAEAVAAAEELLPDVVVMDVRMPGMDGVEATRRLRAPGNHHRPAVLILTTYRVDEAVYAAVRAGAAGFILKHAVPAELVRAVQALAVGDGWLDPAVTRLFLDDIAARPHADGAVTDGLVATLTRREREVLVLIALGHSNLEIAKSLFLTEGTVKTHVSHLLMKLGVRDRTQAAAAAYTWGLVKHGPHSAGSSTPNG